MLATLKYKFSYVFIFSKKIIKCDILRKIVTFYKKNKIYKFVILQRKIVENMNIFVETVIHEIFHDSLVNRSSLVISRPPLNER